MNKILKILVVLPAIAFVVTGLRWLVAPAGVAPMFGFVLGTAFSVNIETIRQWVEKLSGTNPLAAAAVAPATTTAYMNFRCPAVPMVVRLLSR